MMQILFCSITETQKHSLADHRVAGGVDGITATGRWKGLTTLTAWLP